VRIGELSRRTGVSARALRNYEEQGLLNPERRPSGYREFPEQAVRTVRHIRLLLSAALSTAVIAEILPCVADDTEVLAPTCPELLDGLARERARITATMDELRSARDVLDSIIN
jgi:DNA-binding transcriptional MerR regulator